jgi:flagellar biogenesis protein FliO
MMLFAIWPMYKNWRENPVEAQPGDWSTAMFVLGVVILFVLMLIWSVQ